MLSVKILTILNDRNEAVSSAQSIESEWRGDSSSRSYCQGKWWRDYRYCSICWRSSEICSCLCSCSSRRSDECRSRRHECRSRDFDTAATALVSGFENSIRTMSAHQVSKMTAYTMILLALLPSFSSGVSQFQLCFLASFLAYPSHKIFDSSRSQESNHGFGDFSVGISMHELKYNDGSMVLWELWECPLEAAEPPLSIFMIW